MASDRCIHGLLHGMCSICLRREQEIKNHSQEKQKLSSKAQEK